MAGLAVRGPSAGLLGKTRPRTGNVSEGGGGGWLWRLLASPAGRPDSSSEVELKGRISSSSWQKPGVETEGGIGSVLPCRRDQAFAHLWAPE